MAMFSEPSEPYSSVCGKSEGWGGGGEGGEEKGGFLNIQKSRLLIYFSIIDVKIRGVAPIRVRKFFISVLRISF